jgi:hypothetical protein
VVVTGVVAEATALATVAVLLTHYAPALVASSNPFSRIERPWLTTL